MDKENTWRKTLWLDEQKMELFCHNEQKYVWKQKLRPLTSRTPYLLSSMLMIVSCCRTVLLWNILPELDQGISELMDRPWLHLAASDAAIQYIP